MKYSTNMAAASSLVSFTFAKGHIGYTSSVWCEKSIRIVVVKKLVGNRVRATLSRVSQVGNETMSLLGYTFDFGGVAPLASVSLHCASRRHDAKRAFESLSRKSKGERIEDLISFVALTLTNNVSRLLFYKAYQIFDPFFFRLSTQRFECSFRVASSWRAI